MSGSNTLGWWGIRDPWNTIMALDEFGNGTLDGNPSDGPAFDACGPAVIENVAAAYEKRLPNYSNMGHMRAEMIAGGEWTAGAVVSNPRTSGCYIGNIAWEVPRRGYVVEAFHDYQDAPLLAADIRTALGYRHAVVFIVTNATALMNNETGVHGHFVAVATYSGDNPDGSMGKLLILNSDVAGQHGPGTGQWTPIEQLLAAQPHGYVVMAPKAPAPDVAAAVLTLQQIEAAVQAGVASALKELQPGG